MKYASHYQFCPMCGHQYKSQPQDFAYHCNECNYMLFENLNATGSALIMRNNHSELLLVQRAIDPKKGLWDLPGGFANPNEHPQETAKRELREELSVEITIEKLWGVYGPVPYVFQNKTNYNCDVFFLASIKSGEPQPADDVADYKWFTLDSLPANEEIAFPSAQQAVEEIKNNFS